MELGIVIPAAGRGKRMKAKINKQFLTLGDCPILAHTIDKFYRQSEINQIVVVVHQDEMEYCQKEIIKKFDYQGIQLVAGGETRRESVYAGLMAFSPAIDYVIIHDGARPLISETLLNRVIKALEEHDAVTTGVKVKDTIKRRNKNDLVLDALKRDELVAVQTPQAFNCNLIKRAHQEVPKTARVSDDATLVELVGHPVKIIMGSYDNIKVTTPVDLTYATYIMKNRGDIE